MTRRDLTAACGVFAAGAALLAAGCGGGAPAVRKPPPSGVPSVSLELRGARGDVQMLACSLIHHYARFPKGNVIHVAGELAPTPHKASFKVKVKIKRCVDGRFQDSGSWRVVGAAGRYAGTIEPPGTGVFFARARYRDARGDSFSDKVYFRVG